MNNIMASSSKLVQRTGGLAPAPRKRNMPFRQGPPMREKTRKVEAKDPGYPVAVTGNGTTSNDSQEELYQLYPNSDTAPRPFCMLVRLTPEILEELKQGEAGRTTPMMKFGANGSGHAIRIGDENIKFSSAPEPGDLCDIFEEIQQKFLIETGSVWRKLSVLRTLSASEKDRVKLRTAEAEKKQKSRKSILVDPNTQVVLPQTVVTEVTTKNAAANLQKEPPLKRLKVTGSPVGSIPNLPHSNVISLADGHRIDLHSSLSSKPINVTERITHAGSCNLPKDQAAAEGSSIGYSTDKGVSIIPKENTPNTSTHIGSGDGRTKGRINMSEVRNNLITLLQENPKGMTIKAIEKAVTESMNVQPDRKLIEKVIKSIASYRAPGKYLLKSGVEKEIIVEMSDPRTGGDKSFCTMVTEEQLSSDILKVDFGKEKDPEEMQNISPQQSETLSEKAMSPQIMASEIQELKGTQEDSLVVSNPEAASSDEDSGSSSSSECGTESDSDSGSSESVTASSNDTDSSSESDASSSSSETVMDEDVDADVDIDIMSDDEDNKKMESKQEKPIVEDGELQLNDQTLTVLHRDTNVKETTSENIIQSVFGSDGGDGFVASARLNEIEHLESMKKDMTEMMELNKDKCFSSEKLDMDSGPTERNDVHQNSTLVELDTEKAKTFENLGILIDKICENNGEGKSGVTNKTFCQSPRSLNSTDIKDSDNQHLHSHWRANEPLSLGKKEQSGDNSSERSLQLNLVSKGETLVRAKGRTKGMEKFTNESNKLKQASARKLSRSGSKRIGCTDNRVIETKVTDINTENGCLSTAKDKSPNTISKLSFPVENTNELQIGGTSGYGMCKKEDVQVKERVSKSNSKSKINKGMAKQIFNQMDGSGISKSSQTSIKDSEELIVSYQGASLDECPTKNRGKNVEFLKRLIPVEQQAENPLKDICISSKYGSLARKDVPREESVGRALSNGGYSRDGQSLEITNSGSGLSSHREDDVHRVPLQDSELGEFKEPFSGNECSEHSRKFSRTEIIKSKAAMDGKKSVNVRKSQSVSLSSSEISKQSSAPVDAFENNGQQRYEAVGTSKLPRKRLVSNEPRQTSHVLVKGQRGKEGSSVRERGTDRMNYEDCNKITSSKFSSVSQKRTSSMPGSKHKNLTPEIMSKHISGRVKKHTPQSSEVQGSEFFAPYEKKQPELRGPIYNSEQFREYHKEFREKYPIYVRLNKTIEINKEEFTVFWNNIEQAKFGGDKDKLASIYTEVRKEYLHCRKRCKRMRQTFNILHEELQAIKRRCQEYYAQITKR